MEFKPMQPPENFDLWLLEPDNETIKNIYCEIVQYKKYAPNFEYFVFNFFDLDNFFDNFYCKIGKFQNELSFSDISKYKIEFVNTFDIITNTFDITEKTIYYKILEYYVYDCLQVQNSILKDAKKEQVTGYKHYTEIDVINFKNRVYIFNDVHEYFEFKYNQNKHILPFTIHDKKNISNVIDENPDLSWFIDNKTQTATAPEPQQFTFENNFDEVNKDIVYNYFKENLVDKKYISIEVLERFLIMAFQEKNPPENKFVFDKHTTKRNMINIFHHYYKVINQNSYGKKNEYVNLLCNYFIGYDAKKVDANFNN